MGVSERMQTFSETVPENGYKYALIPESFLTKFSDLLFLLLHQILQCVLQPLSGLKFIRVFGTNTLVS